MRVNQLRDSTLRGYLLGEIEEEPRLALEERLVMDPELFERLGPSEDELTEDYLEGVLSPAERRGFERHFLINDDRRWQVGFVRLLKDRASAGGVSRTGVTAATRIIPLRVERTSADGAERIEAQPPLLGRAWINLASAVGANRTLPSWTGALAASIAVLLVGGTTWFATRGDRVGRELWSPRTDQEVVQREQNALKMRADGPSSEPQAPRQTGLESKSGLHGTEARVPPVEAPSGRTALRPAPPTFVLATGLLRSGGGAVTRIAIPPSAEVVRLRLQLSAADYSRYRTVLYDAESVEMWAQSGLTARGDRGRAAIVIILPAAVLSRGDYLIKVSGLDGGVGPETIASYSFRVVAPDTR
jgi:hypothetical protein